MGDHLQATVGRRREPAFWMAEAMYDVPATIPTLVRAAARSRSSVYRWLRVMVESDMVERTAAGNWILTEHGRRQVDEVLK